MIEIIITTIFIYTIINIILKRLNIPTIIWYIITWTAISYIFWLKDVSNNHELKLIAEMWVVFLMFTIGLELPMKKLAELKKDVFLVWWLQVFISFIFFSFISNFFFKIDLTSSLIIGAALSLSSTAIVLKTINENNEINKTYGKKILSILLFQDLAVIPILVFISILSIEWVSINSLIAEIILWTLALMLIVWFTWKNLLDKFLYLVSKTESQEIFISAIILLLLWISYEAHLLWLSFSLWALITWILIAETHYKHQVEADLIPFRNLLLWVFFITVWMQLDLLTIKENIFIIILLLVIVTFSKIIIVYFISRIFTNKEDSLRTSLSLFQVWEFAIVIFELSTSYWIIEKSISQILIITIIISMVITPIILNNISYIINKTFKNKYNIENKKEIKTKNIVVIWYSRLWKAVCEILKEKNLKYIIIEKKLKAFKEWYDKWEPIIYWDATYKLFLKNINIENSKYVIVTIWYEDRLYKICKTINSVAKKSQIIVKTSTFEDKKLIDKIKWIKKIVVETENTAVTMIKELD